MISFSIIIPSLNNSSFINLAINSVLSQEYPDKEIIVIDGGSGDGTVDILKKYSADIQWISEPDDGQSDAINKGFRISSGEIVSWLNADDELFPGSLSILSKAFERNPQADLIYGNCNYIDSTGKTIRQYPTQDYNYHELVENAYSYLPQPATFFKRELFNSIGYLNEELNYVMDFEYWIRVGKKAKIINIPNTLASLRLHQDAKSIKEIVNFASELEWVYNHHVDGSDLPVEIDKKRAMVNMYNRAAHSAYWGYDLEKSREYILKAWRMDNYRPSRLLLQILLASIGFHFGKFRRNPYLIME